MRKNSFLPVMLVLASAAALPLSNVAAEAPLLVKRGDLAEALIYRNEKFGFEFQYPASFVIGAYKTETRLLDEGSREKLRMLGEDPEERERPFQDAVVLVEPALLGDTPVTEIPVGEVSTIMVYPRTGNKARFYKRLYEGSESIKGQRIAIGPYDVAKFPGAPGPYGENAFYYLLPLSDELVVEFSAHRQRFSNLSKHERTEGETWYDDIIEQIISTVRLAQ